jgi:23S rRNA (guanosine2251-2'-O)-methyltransferase
MSIASGKGIHVERVSRNALRGFEPQARDVVLELPENVGATASLEEALESADSDALVLILDHIEDPRNYGAILRSADQFGVSSILVPGKRAAPLSAATVESSAGTAQFATIVTVSNLASAMEELKEAGFWIYAAAAGGTPAEQANLTGKVALILGNEGKGVSRLVTERSDETISIPRTGHADSLNVSVAAGVLLYEVRRQQGWTVRHG